MNATSIARLAAVIAIGGSAALLSACNRHPADATTDNNATTTTTTSTTTTTPADTMTPSPAASAASQP